MINWNKKPYSESEFVDAWNDATFVDDAAHTLGVTASTGNLRTLNRIAEQCDLHTLPVWNKSYSVQEFTDAWNQSLTIHEVATRLGLSSIRGLKAAAEVLELPEHTASDTTYTKEQFLSAWDSCDYLDEVAVRLELSTSKQSLAKLMNIARTLGLPAKRAKVYTTDTGEDASSIVADWIDWHNDHYQVNPLNTHVKIAAKTVKELIMAKYGTQSIKWGLFQWTLAIHRGYADPSIITKMTHKHHLDMNPQVAQIAQALETQEETIQPISKIRNDTYKAPVIEAKRW